MQKLFRILMAGVCVYIEKVSLNNGSFDNLDNKTSNNYEKKS
jgi:hypothetical protein